MRERDGETEKQKRAAGQKKENGKRERERGIENNNSSRK